MLPAVVLFLAFAGVEARGTSRASLRTSFTSPLAKRDLMSCKETYGAESKQCGPSNSGFCYDPSSGQSCCETDYGFCTDGSYCAPVGGYCCFEGETVEECAEAAGFEIPPSAKSTADGDVEAMDSPTPTSVPGSDDSGPSSFVPSPNSADSTAAAETTPSVVTTETGSGRGFYGNGTIPFVTVASAPQKNRSVLLRLSLGMVVTFVSLL